MQIADARPKASDPYTVLGVDRLASLGEIKKAYAELLKRHQATSDTEALEKIRSAFETLRRGSNTGQAPAAAASEAVEIPEILRDDESSLRAEIAHIRREKGEAAALDRLHELTTQAPRDGRLYVEGYRLALESGGSFEETCQWWKQGLENGAPVGVAMLGDLSDDELVEFLDREKLGWNHFAGVGDTDARSALWQRSMDRAIARGDREWIIGELQNALLWGAASEDQELHQSCLTYLRYAAWMAPERVRSITQELAPSQAEYMGGVAAELKTIEQLEAEEIDLPEEMKVYLAHSCLSIDWALHVSARTVAKMSTSEQVLTDTLILADKVTDFAELLEYRARLLLPDGPSNQELDDAQVERLKGLVGEYDAATDSSEVGLGLALIAVGAIYLPAISLFAIFSDSFGLSDWFSAASLGVIALVAIIWWIARRDATQSASPQRAQKLMQLAQAQGYPDTLKEKLSFQENKLCEKHGPFLFWLCVLVLGSRQVKDASTTAPPEPKLGGTPDRARGMPDLHNLLALPKPSLLEEAEAYLTRAAERQDWPRYELGIGVFADELSLRDVFAWRTAKEHSEHRTLILGMTLVSWAWRANIWAMLGASDGLVQRIRRYRYVTAGRMLLAATQLAPENPVGWALLIRVARNLALPLDQGKLWFQRAVSCDPHSWLAHAELCSSLSERSSNDPELAADFVRDVTERSEAPQLAGLIPLAALQQLVAGVQIDQETFPWVISSREVEAALSRSSAKLRMLRDEASLNAWNNFACFAFATHHVAMLSAAFPHASRNPTEDPWYMLGEPKEALRRAEAALRGRPT